MAESELQDRRSVFREFMRRMNPKADPAAALREGMYVSSPLSTSNQVATRIELEPGGTHLVIGATGSGKTTELLAIQQHLQNVGDIAALFQDVPAVQQLTVLAEGSLIGLAWKMIWADLEQRTGAAAAGFKNAKRAARLADGFWTDNREQYEEGDDFDWVPGLVSPPARNSEVEELLGYLKEVTGLAPIRYVLLFDGLDRVREIPKLTAVLIHDLFKLSDIGIGSVVVGPPELRGSSYREFSDRFATFHFHGALDPGRADARSFFERVLEARSVGHVLHAPEMVALGEWSGGIMRDLISLAKNAGETAYARGHDTIDMDDVNDAADRFGRALLVGISEKSALRLSELSTPSHRQRYFEFTVASPDDLDLLLRRLIIEVMEVPPKFFIHPTVRPLVRGLRKAI